MKKYRKNTGIVDAVQFDGSEESLNEIRELLGDKANLIDQVAPEGKSFELVGKKKNYRIFRTDWIIKDEINNEHTLCFVVSDDIFQISFTEDKPSCSICKKTNLDHMTIVGIEQMCDSCLKIHNEKK